MPEIISFGPEPKPPKRSGHGVGIPITSFQDYQITIENSTADLGGTITALSKKINEIADRLDAARYQSDPESIISEFNNFRGEISDIKSNVFPKLEKTQKTLENVASFLNSNSSFLSDLISANGRLNGIQGEMNSITRRLDNLEKTKERNWHNITTIISIFIAIAAVIVAIFF